MKLAHSKSEFKRRRAQGDSELFKPLPRGPFQVIYCDPPWSYRGQVQHGGADKPFTSSAGSFYDVISIEDLCTLPVKDIRDPEQSICFMWTTGPILEDSLRLMKAWGFKYKQIAFVWDKQRVNPGAYTMTQCEYVIVGTRGRIPKPRGARNIRQFLQYPRSKHSAKPEAIRDRIHQMFPEQQKIELFARNSDPRFVAWGLEV